MCYTIKIDLSREQLEKRFGAKLTDGGDYRPGDRVNAFSLPLLPVICNDSPHEIRLYRWGLIPYWVRSAEDAASIRIKTFNAKSETLSEKPSFRSLVTRRHCLVLVNGFYEWQSLDKARIPYFIGLRGGQAFALAGLYDRWAQPEGGELTGTFTVITTRANPLLEQIHNVKKRMPVILSPSLEREWLSAQAGEVQKFFDPYPEELMTAEKVDPSLFRRSAGKDVGGL